MSRHMDDSFTHKCLYYTTSIPRVSIVFHVTKGIILHTSAVPRTKVPVDVVKLTSIQKEESTLFFTRIHFTVESCQDGWIHRE